MLRIGLLLGAVLAGSPALAQREFRELVPLERDFVSLPADYDEPGEFVVGRLMFPSTRRRNVLGAGGGDYKRGASAWAVDYPRGDRTFASLLRRLTGIDVRSVEQPVDLDDGDDPFHWPFLISGLVGAWELTDAQAAKLREYLLRGGFLLCDSFYGSNEWAGFVEGMRRVFPDRPIVELADDHPIFHIVYDLTDRPQVPTWQHLPRGYRDDGADPHWRAILDDDGRVMVMIAFNNDIADGWQWADEPRYPQERATLAIRRMEKDTGLRVPIVAMTANSSDRDKKRCREAGFDDYLVKPVKLADLRAHIHKWTRGAMAA